MTEETTTDTGTGAAHCPGCVEGGHRDDCPCAYDDHRVPRYLVRKHDWQDLMPYSGCEYGIWDCKRGAFATTGWSQQEAAAVADLYNEQQAARDAAPKLQPCWNAFCILETCDGEHHGDYTGHSWTQRRGTAYNPETGKYDEAGGTVGVLTVYERQTEEKE